MAYYSLHLRFTSNPALRTQWHPDSPVGPFSVITRGAFETEAEALAWGERMGIHPDTYTLIRHSEDCEQ